eukprot:gene8459-1511_t
MGATQGASEAADLMITPFRVAMCCLFMCVTIVYAVLALSLYAPPPPSSPHSLVHTTQLLELPRPVLCTPPTPVVLVAACPHTPLSTSFAEPVAGILPCIVQFHLHLAYLANTRHQ